MQRIFTAALVAIALVVFCMLPSAAFAGKGDTCTEGHYPPLVGSDTYALGEGTSMSVSSPGVLGNDESRRTDSPGLAVAQWWIGYPDYNHASWVTYADNGSFTFTPPASFSGSVSYYYTVSDLDSPECLAAGLVNFVVTSEGNDPPITQNDTLVVDEDVPGIANVLANDTDPDGDTITIESVQSGQNGVCTVELGQVRYVPAPDFNGYDSCTVTISDGAGGTDTSTLYITINAVSDAPTAQNDTLIVDEDVSGIASVVANDTDPDGDTITIESVVGGQNGTCTVETDRVRYTPSSNFNGADSCTVTISDGAGGTDTSTLSITINAVNDAPVARFTVIGGIVKADADGSSSTDVDGDSLTYTWNFSDGTGYQSGGATIGHQFRLPGDYTVILTVTDASGASNTLRQTVNVLPNVLRTAETNVSTQEGAKNANHVVNVVVNLAQANLLPVTFSYATSNGSATASTDYYAASGNKTIPAGQTSISIPVTIIGDNNRREVDETFSVNISQPNYGVVLANTTTTVTIVNDD